MHVIYIFNWMYIIIITLYMHLEDTVNTVLVIATFSLAKILHMSCIDFFPFLVVWVVVIW